MLSFGAGRGGRGTLSSEVECLELVSILFVMTLKEDGTCGDGEVNGGNGKHYIWKAVFKAHKDMQIPKQYSWFVKK